jgi:hypothetical protein
MIRDPMKVLMIAVGIILLLPGICALLFAIGLQFDRDLIGLWVICFLISACGVALLYAASHRRQTNGPAGG